MNKKQEKSFIRTNIIIYVITMIIMWTVCYLMKDMELWQTLIALLTIFTCSTIINALNLVFHIKKK